MQSMSAYSARGRWQRWGRILFLGMFLALIQIGLIALLFLEQYTIVESSFWATPATSLFFYLLIPGVEGFLTSREDNYPRSGVKRACFVGLVTLCVFALLAAVASVLLLPRLLLGCDCSNNFSGLMLAFVAGFLAFEALGSIGGGLLGGWIGKRLAQRQARV